MTSIAEDRSWELVDDSGFLDEVIDGLGLEDAVREAEALAGEQVVFDSVYEIYDVETDLAANARVLPVMQRKALSRSTLPVVTDREVMSLSVEQAHARLVSYFPSTKGKTAITKWQRPDLMVGGLLRDNYKQQKKHPSRRSLVSTGLPLAPNAIAFQRMGKEEGPSRRQPQGAQQKTLCAGSNEFCRGSCLVYTGQHGADPYNLKLKVATTEALIREPVAFLRILVAAIELFSAEQRQCRKKPCFRLNVLSDVPWEVVYPELFHRFEREQFYDYTKVEGRIVPPNYDLTFSFSGTNWRQLTGKGNDGCSSELAAGRRVSVVFFARRQTDYPLPERLLGYEVLDGTTHDFRFTDPGRVVVGLRYLTPNTQLLTTTPKRAAKALAARRFLVPCWVTPDGDVVAAETPRAAEAFWFGEEE